ELVGEKRGYQLALALERLALRAGEFQRIGLSATVGSPDVAARFLGGKNREIRIVDVSRRKRYEIHVLFPQPDEETKKEAKELGFEASVYARLKAILEILQRHKQVITFVNTRSMAEQLSYYLKKLHEETEIHHSSLSRETRILTEKLFREGKVKHVVATSSLELGIDIGDVDAVIQYGSPRQVIRLIQRVGRSGHRWDRPSVGYVIATNPLEYVEALAIKELLEEGWMEPIEYEEKPYDVLAHQVAGLLMDVGEFEIEEMLELFRRAFPYFDLSREELLEVIAQLESEGYLRVEGQRVRRSRWTWRYYYSNLSMIPDEEKFFVVDVASRRNVAMLDEDFVSEYLEPGTVFVVRGRTWRVLAIEGRDVLVEEYPAGGAIPAWIGEQIPVHRVVAQRVREMLAQGAPVDYFKDYREPREVLIEESGRYAIVHSFLGSKGNQTLARLIASEISRRYGVPVRVVSSPYTVFVEFPVKARADIVKEVLTSTPEHIVDILLERLLPRTSLFRMRFIHVARRFGLISRGARVEKVNVRKLVEALSDSPIFKETVKEILSDKLDVEAVKVFFRELGEVKVSGLTELGRVELSSVLQMPDVLVPEDPEKVMLQKFKERILNRRVHFVCLYCGFSFSRKVSELPEKIECPACGSPLLAVSTDPEYDAEIVKKGKRGRKEDARYRSLLRSAELVKHFGKRAVIAQAVEGIGSLTAARILRIPYSEEEFWKALLDAEREYFRTRLFWKA
ncbi:MAG: DEAD/DEAH box helicase, partial [Candidatus Diapherotrites archaeon]|nr:DEAD/DEAH box helicase [Candidatus Diapherotrites archaeon]